MKKTIVVHLMATLLATSSAAAPITVAIPGEVPPLPAAAAGLTPVVAAVGSTPGISAVDSLAAVPLSLAAPQREPEAEPGAVWARSFDGTMRTMSDINGVSAAVGNDENFGPVPELQPQVAAAQPVLKRIFEEIGRGMVGQKEMIESLVIAMISGGHILLEGNPGTGKTQGAKTTAVVVNGSFSRIQGTSDLLPRDILGGSQKVREEWELKKGPIFARLLLVDEVNRLMPKTQSALLEAMGEGQVTIEGVTHKLEKPFIVVATQNPLEQVGTNPLPEAQRDRFMMWVRVPRATVAENIEIRRRYAGREEDRPVVRQATSLEELSELGRVAEKIHVSAAIDRYVADLIDATETPEKHGLKNNGNVAYGAGTRADMDLIKAARLIALFEGRAYVKPEDVRRVAHRILDHRIGLSVRAPRDMTTAKIVDALLDQIPVPRG